MSVLSNRSTLAVALAMALAVPATALAQTQSRSQAQASASRQPTVVVTAQRLPQPVEHSLAALTVLERADIEASQAPDLPSLLARLPGVDMARTGGPGSATSVFMRGSNSNHTLVLVDGIRVNVTGSGGFDLSHLLPDQIERIEIVRGPRAALWGSDAIGGVIHITTRRPEGAATSLRAGSYGRAEGSVALGHAGDAGHVGLTAGAARLRGFSATNERAFGHDPDDDGYRNRHIGLRAGTGLGGHQIEAHLLATRAEVEFDTGLSDVDNVTGGLRLAGHLGTDWTHSLAVGHTRDELATPAFASTYESRRSSVDWANVLALPVGQFGFGLAWQREEGESGTGTSTTYARSRSNRGAFAGYAARLGRHDLELAARFDDNSQFGDATTGSAGWGWHASDTVRLRAGWGEGFRAPSFNELYSPGFGGRFAGNPALAPERSRSLELGLDWLPADGQRLGLSAYRSHIRDLISFTGPNSQAINIARAEIDGVEADYAGRFGRWDLSGNLGWLDPINADTGQRLLRRARHRANASVAHHFDGGLMLALDAGHAGPRGDIGATLPTYTVWHLRAALPLGQAWRIEARVENLFDKDYELVRGYNTPGRSVVFGLHWSPPR